MHYTHLGHFSEELGLSLFNCIHVFFPIHMVRHRACTRYRRVQCSFVSTEAQSRVMFTAIGWLVG